MKGRSLLAFTALAVAFACDTDRHPTGISEVNVGKSSVLSDGANGGNPDFFFLPPLVKKPKHDPNFELGKFNNSIQPSLTVEICALESTTGLPAPATECDGEPVKTFGAGTVQLVNLPGPKPGLPRGFNPESWWKGHGRADGFYYVLWNTRQPGLNPDKYYRIKVLVEGADAPLGYVDVDVKTKGRKWQHSRTSDVIELIDGVMLPIPFRVEKGAFCEDASACGSGTIINTPNGPEQIVVVEGPNGPIGGAAFPPDFLPEDGPQSIVVTISRVRTQRNGGPPGTLCHPGLRSQQFEGCFKFETIPELEPIGESNDQFTRDVRVAVCFELDGTEDARNEYVQLWASDGERPPRRLPPASDEGILTSAAARDCGDPSQVGSSESNGVMGFASVAWRKIQGGFSSVFGVKTAYAVDKGLGGLVKGFSNIGPVLTTQITRNEQTDLPVGPADTITATVRIIGGSHHDEEEGPPTGLGGQPVTFSVAASNGVLGLVGGQGVGATTISMLSGSGSVEDEEPAGFAEVRWALPEQPGVYKLLATGAGPSDTVSFTVTVEAPIPPPPPNFRQLGVAETGIFSMQTGSSIQVGVPPPNTFLGWTSSQPVRVQVSPTGLVTAIVGGESPAGGAESLLTSTLGNENPGPSIQVNSFSFNQFPRITTLVWNPVIGATNYQVVTEFGNSCQGVVCEVWTVTSLGSLVSTGTTFTFDQFVGAQPGRWRIFARSPSGVLIHTSPYVYFAYII